MVLAAILLAVLAAGLLLGVPRARLWALLAGAWVAALALALILPRAVSLRMLGWDWRAMLIVTALGLLMALYIHLIRRLRRLSGIDALRSEADAARAEGAALQAGIAAARAHRRAEAMRVPASDTAPPVLVAGPARVAAPICLALADAGVTRIALAGEGTEPVARAIAALHPGCHVSEGAAVEGCAVVLAVGDAAALGRACAAAGVVLVHGWLADAQPQVAIRHPASDDPGIADPHGSDAIPRDGSAQLLGALMARAALDLLHGPQAAGRGA